MGGVGGRQRQARGEAPAHDGVLSDPDALQGQLLHRDLLFRSTSDPELIVYVLDFTLVHSQPLRRTGDQLVDDLAGRLLYNHGHAVGDSAATADVGVSDVLCVADGDGDLLPWEAQGLCDHLPCGGAGPVEVHRAHHQRRGAVPEEGDVSAGGQHSPCPESRGHPPAHVGSVGLGRGPHLVALDPLQDRLHPDGAQGRVVGKEVVVLDNVLHPELQGVHADGPGHLVHLALHGEAAEGRPGSAVGLHPRLVGDHFVPRQLKIGDPVGGDAAAQGSHQG